MAPPLFPIYSSEVEITRVGQAKLCSTSELAVLERQSWEQSPPPPQPKPPQPKPPQPKQPQPQQPPPPQQLLRPPQPHPHEAGSHTLTSMDNMANALRDAGQHMEVAPLDAHLDAASIDLLVSRAGMGMVTDEEERALQAAASYNDVAADYLVSRAEMSIATDDEQRALCKATAAGNTLALSWLMRLHSGAIASDEEERAIAQAIRRRWGNTAATDFINGDGFPLELDPGLFGIRDGTSICEQAEKQREQLEKQREQAVKQREPAVHHHEQGGCVII